MTVLVSAWIPVKVSSTLQYYWPNIVTCLLAPVHQWGFDFGTGNGSARSLLCPLWNLGDGTCTLEIILCLGGEYRVSQAVVLVLSLALSLVLAFVVESWWPDVHQLELESWIWIFCWVNWQDFGEVVHRQVGAIWIGFPIVLTTTAERVVNPEGPTLVCNL